MKKGIILLAILLLCFSLSACDENNNNSNNNENSKNEENLRKEISNELKESFEKEKEELKKELRKEIEDELASKEKETEDKNEETNDSKDETKTLNNDSNKLHAKNLKVGDMIDNHKIIHLNYTEGNRFEIALDGTYKVAGKLVYDDIYHESFTFTPNDDKSYEEINFTFDEEYSITPPLGVFQITNIDLQNFKSRLGTEVMELAQTGMEIDVTLTLSKYFFGTQNHSEPFYSCKIDEIISASLNGNELALFESQDPLSLNQDTILESSRDEYYRFKSDQDVYFDLNKDGTLETINYDYEGGQILFNNIPVIEISVEEFATKDFIIVNYIDNNIDTYLVGIFDPGPSADPLTTLYMLVNKELIKIGSIEAKIIREDQYTNIEEIYDFTEGEIEDYLYASEQFMGTAFIKKGIGISAPFDAESIIPLSWYARTNYAIDTKTNQLYDSYSGIKDYETYAVLETIKDVNGYSSKALNGQNITISPNQRVLIYATNNKDRVAIRTEDGKEVYLKASDVNRDNFRGFVIFD